MTVKPRPEPVKAVQPCAVCGMVLESMDGDPDVPYAGDIFTANGHYGSTMYDPVFGGEHLTLTICTACLTGMRARGAVTRTLQGVHGAEPERLIWGEPGEAERDNPRNELRLKNERALAVYAGSNPQAMYPGLYAELMELCDLASLAGVAFNPYDAVPPAAKTSATEEQA
jgi:hypothetical protein